MSTTRLANVIYGAAFLPTVILQTASLSTIRNSGIASTDADIQKFANGPGDIVQMPFWSDLAGSSNVSSDDPAVLAVPQNLSQGQDIARKLRRNIGWETANLVAAVIAEDPALVLAKRIGNYWNLEEQRLLVAELNGVFAAASMAGSINDVASADGNNPATRVVFDAETAADSYALLGDAGTSITGVMMHSRVFWNLHAARAIEYGVDPVTGLAFTRWDGKDVIVSDSLPRVAGGTSGFIYTSYLFGRGAIAYAEATGAGGPKTPVEIASVAAAGNGEGIETFWYRRHWVMHPRGVKFNSSTTVGNSPTDAELALGTNWERVYDPKQIRIVAVKTNG